MITQVNEKNAAKYRKLFDKASELLGCSKISATDKDGDTLKDENGDAILILDPDDVNYIADLYEYFIAFPAILQAAELKDNSPEAVPGDNQYWKKYFTILPLDEPVFEVDANTRKINIPSQFKTVGVEGDNTAEIVFFLIDRFFDAMDFGSKEILAAIEWQRLSGSNPVKDVDKAYIKELTLYNNKVLIGWIINKEITEEAGNIEFALRLFTQDPDGSTDYSFSTEPARVTIAKTLNIYPESETELDDEPIAQVLSRIASITSPDNLWGDDNLLAPTFGQHNIGNLVDSDGNPIVYAYTKESPSGEFYADLNPDTFTAEVMATSNNATGNISYQWYYWDYKLKDWQKDGQETSGAAGGNIKVLNKVGRYKCVAIDKASGYRRSIKDSEILYILAPEKPVVREKEENTEYYSSIIKENGVTISVKPILENGKFISGQFDNSEPPATDISFSWKKSDDLEGIKQDIPDINTRDYLATDEGYYFGSAIATRNKESIESDKSTIYRVTKDLQLPTEDNYEIEGIASLMSLSGKIGETIVINFINYPFDTLEYQWYENFTLDGDYVISQADGNHGIVTGGLIEFTPTAPGWYKVNIIVKRNGQIMPKVSEGETNIGHELFGPGIGITMRQ